MCTFIYFSEINFLLDFTSVAKGKFVDFDIAFESIWFIFVFEENKTGIRGRDQKENKSMKTTEPIIGFTDSLNTLLVIF